jgi:sterol desaturase/sphingolipid hydroxylase (fatty acid hydroxylase superfamily)
MATLDGPTIYSLTRPLQHVRAGDLTTKRDAFGVFASHPSARAITVAVTTLVAARVGLGEAGRGEVIAPLATVVLAGPVEWVVHRDVLHSSRRRSPLRSLGAGHRRHHEQPGDLRWLLMSAGEATLAVLAIGVLSAAWSIPLAILVGASPAGTFLTAWASGSLWLLHYEWVHLLVHTRYRPRTRRYAQLARQHRLHHHRDERSWFGITTLLGDRLLRTAPRAVGPAHRLGNS